VGNQEAGSLFPERATITLRSPPAASSEHQTHDGHRWLQIYLIRASRLSKAAISPHAGRPLTRSLLPPPPRPLPQVADEFKKKYYDVLSNNPRLFARFFKEDSALTVSMPDAQPESGNGPEVRVLARRWPRRVCAHHRASMKAPDRQTGF
jgi:hypothetical protein